MRACSAQRQVCGSTLIDTRSKLEQLAALLSVDAASLRLTRLFSTSVNGWNPATFHKLCDDQGATLTFVKGPSGSYGGYTSISWASKSATASDPAAFLFRCRSAASGKYKKFQPNGNGHEICPNSGYGPCFGFKHDFFTFDSSRNIFREQSYGHTASFSLSGPLIDSSSLKNTRDWELEVLQVGHFNPAEGECEHSWLSGFSWQDKAAKHVWKQVAEFHPQQQGLAVQHINILLCGGVGAGKSSVICTLDSLCKGRKSDRASHGQGTGSLSRQLRKYSFRSPESGQPFHWRLWDTMGWGVKDYKKGELEYILDGNLPDRCKLDQGISFKTPGFNQTPTAADKVHCVCFVVPCGSASDESYMARLCEMRDVVRTRDIRMLILLTKIDTYDPDIIGANLRKTFHSARLQVLMEDLLESSGMGGLNDIHPIQNLSRESTVSMEASILLCTALRAALFAAVDYLEDDPDSMDQDPPSTYLPSKEEKLAIATKDHNGRNGVLTLKKDQYLWVTPSSSQNGWLVGHDDHGNRGQVLERMITLIVD